MLVANSETGEVTEGQVEAIKAGLQRLTWPAALVEPAVGWAHRRTGDGIQLCDARVAHGCAVRSGWNRVGSARG